MLITEYDRDMDIAVNRREAWEEGLAEGRTVGLAEGRTEGRAEGRTEGLAEGRAEEKTDNARKMKVLGLSTDQIQAVTGLSANEINNLN